MIVGKKFDTGKNQLDLILPEFVWEMGEVLTHGAIAYGPNNWMLVEGAISRYRAARLRHIIKSNIEPFDNEMGLSHHATTAVNSMFLWHFESRRDLGDIAPCICEKCREYRTKTL
jgi:hypothetical protein